MSRYGVGLYFNSFVTNWKGSWISRKFTGVNTG
jgi:hypothetical protein